jgi:hypothetical protein
MQEYNRLLNMPQDSFDRLSQCRRFAERTGWGGAWLMCARISSRMRMDSTSLELYQKAAEVNCAPGSNLEGNCNEATDRVWWYLGRVHTPSFVPGWNDGPGNDNGVISLDNLTYLQAALSMYKEHLVIALAAQKKLAQTKDDILHYVGDNSKVAEEFENIRSRYEQSNPTADAYRRLLDLKQNVETQSQTISDMTLEWAKQTKTNNANLQSIQANINFLQQRIAALPQ